MSLRRSTKCGNLSEPVHEFGKDAVISFGFLTDNEFNYTRFKFPPDGILLAPDTNLKNGLSELPYPEQIMLLDRFRNYTNHTAIRMYPCTN